jgi:hypothetical protein
VADVWVDHWEPLPASSVTGDKLYTNDVVMTIVVLIVFTLTRVCYVLEEKITEV